jgi:hypothetical protein
MSDRAEPSPTVVRSVAVTVDDVVTALETTRRSGRSTVLRLTPPFSARMRARLHRPSVTDESGDAVHLDPAALVENPPPYPDPDRTEDELRAAGEYSRERHRERHADAVDAWRAAVRESVADTVTIETAAGETRVAVKPLG